MEDYNTQPAGSGEFQAGGQDRQAADTTGADPRNNAF